MILLPDCAMEDFTFLLSHMWHSSYYTYGILDDPDHREIQETYLTMQENDTLGVTMPHDIIIPSLESTPSSEGITFTKPAQEQVQNYPLEHQRPCMDGVINNPNYLQFASIIPVGITQQSNLNHQAFSSQSDDNYFTLQNDRDYERFLQNDLEDAHVFDNMGAFSKFKASFCDACNADCN